jgi:hypothetical protein
LAAVTQGVAAAFIFGQFATERGPRVIFQCRRTSSFPEWVRCAIPPSLSILLLPVLAATLIVVRRL